MTQHLSAGVKLEKLVKLSLHRQWRPASFLKLCTQFQETHESIDSAQIASALIAANSSLPLNHLFIEYIVGLVSDSKSILPLASLLTYLSSNDPPITGDILIYLGNCFNIVMTCEATSELQNFISNVSSKITAEKSGGSETGHTAAVAKGLAYFVAQYMRYHNVDSQVLTTFGQSMQLVDPFLATRLDTSSFQLNEMSFDLLKNDSSTGFTPTNVETSTDLPLAFAPSLLKTKRASRLVWLESLFPLRIQGDDLYRELDMMFAADKSATVDSVLVQFLETAFDCMAVALQNQDPKLGQTWKLFITKRYPALVYELQNKITSVKSVVCGPVSGLDASIIELLRIYGGGDALDEMFSSFPSTTTDIRHDLLQSALDLQLVNLQDVTQTLKENMDAFQPSQARGPSGADYISLPEGGADLEIGQIKQRLEAEADADASAPAESSILFQVLKLVDDLDGVRQAKIARLVLSAMDDWSQSQNMAPLGRMCLTLTLLPDAMDILFMYISGIQVGQLLGKFLNTWTCQDDDLQEPYADYGRIYLFCEYIWKRYALDNAIDQSSFTHMKLGETRYQSTSLTPLLDSMTEERKNLLGGWIAALFDAEGIGDDLMHMSTASDILVLVPSIFQNIILAVYSGILDIETVKGGFEYFSQPFLLPSLVDGFKALGQLIQFKATNATPILKILQKLVSPGTLSKSSNEMFDCVMTLAAPNLRKVLVWLKSQLSQSEKSKDSNTALIDQLLGTLETYLENTKEPVYLASRDFAASARETVTSLTAWTQACDRGQVSCPPRHTIQWLSVGVDTLGGRRMLSILLDVLDYAESVGSIDDAIEITVALINGAQKHERYSPLTMLESSIATAVRDTTDDQMASLRASSGGLLSENLRRLQNAIKASNERRHIGAETRLFPQTLETSTTTNGEPAPAAMSVSANSETATDKNNIDLMDQDQLDLGAGLDADVDMTFGAELDGAAYGDLTGFDENMMLMDL